MTPLDSRYGGHDRGSRRAARPPPPRISPKLLCSRPFTGGGRGFESRRPLHLSGRGVARGNSGFLRTLSAGPRPRAHVGGVAEWLGRGLQNLAQRFNSAPRLSISAG